MGRPPTPWGWRVLLWRSPPGRCVKLELVDIHVSLYQHMCAVAIINDMLKEYTPEMRTAKPTGQAEYMELLQV